MRVGNATAEQFQIDVYGEVADMLLQAGRVASPPHPRSAAIARVIMPFFKKVWRRPDEGIWEVRSDRRHFVHSKVMAWVAFDRSAKMAAETEGGEALSERWRHIVDEIHADVIENGFDRDLNSFVQSYGSKALDASLLHIPMTGFLPADDPRVVGTVEAIEKRLMNDGFVLRYDTGETDDGLSGVEGAFLAFSFTLADVHILQDRHRDALRLFGASFRFGSFRSRGSKTVVSRCRLNVIRLRRRPMPEREDSRPVLSVIRWPIAGAVAAVIRSDQTNMPRLDGAVSTRSLGTLQAADVLRVIYAQTNAKSGPAELIHASLPL